MAESVFVESAKERLDRFQRAKARLENWKSLLEDAYQLTLPRNDVFDKKMPGEERNLDIFDATAMEGLKSFANNLQSILMPPGKRWAFLEPGHLIPDEEQQQLAEFLQGEEEILQRYLERSNFNMVINEAFQDMGISTGFLILNPGTDENPLNFKAVPAPEAVVEEGEDGKLENFWRQWMMPLRAVKRTWPEAAFSQQHLDTLKNAPDTLTKVIEGTIFYPQNPVGKQYYYYIQLEDDAVDIVTEWRDFNPWTGFRFNRAAGEILGRGPVLDALPFIRTLNMMALMELKSAKMRAFPIYIAASTGAFNPYTMDLQPGAIIPIEQNFIDKPPIQPLEAGGDPQFLQLSIENMQSNIRDMLFAEPLGPVQPNQSATEVSIRQQNFVRKSQASFGRLVNELLQPVIHKAIVLLQKRGIMRDFNVDGNRINLRFESPLFELQRQDEFQATQTYLQAMNEVGTAVTTNPSFLLAIDAFKLPELLAKQLNAPMEIVKPEAEIQAGFLKLVSDAQQAQQAQLPPEQQPAPQPVLDNVATQQTIPQS